MNTDVNPNTVTKPIALEGYTKIGYTVDREGNVYSPKRGKLTPQHNTSGRGVFVALINDDGKETRKNVALIVALTFLSNPNHYMLVGFKDGNPENCNVDNLEWIPSARKLKKIRMYMPTAHKENISYLSESLKPRPIAQYTLNGNLVKEWPSVRTASQECSIPFSGIHYCCSGKRKTANGYIWRFVEEGVPAPQKIDGKRKPKTPVHKPKTVNYSALPIDQHTLDDQFIRSWLNAKEAGALFNTKTAHINIIKCARGERKQAYGYIWKFSNYSAK